MVKIKIKKKNQENLDDNKKKSKNPNVIKNRKRKIKAKIRKLNPKFLYFNLDSSFIYESRLCDYHYSNLSNSNKMKLNENDIICINNEIQKVQNLRDNLNDNIISIPTYYASFFENMIKKPLALNERELTVDNIIKNYDGNKSLSCQKIMEIYNDKNIQKISKTTIYRIITKRLGYSFRKTSVKTNKLLTKNSIKQIFFVLKLVSRVLKIGGEIVYVDESAFYNINSNYKAWRKNDQDIHYDIKESKKINLILAVTSNKVVYYKMTNESTDGNAFKSFMSELYNKLSELEKKNYVFFLDNLSSHSTPELFEFYNNNNMKIIFNAPYKSSFNMVELAFRHIKRETYTYLFKIKLKYFYQSTLKEYIKFNDLNNFINLN